MALPVKDFLGKFRCSIPALVGRACLLVSLALCHAPIPLVHCHSGATSSASARTDESQDAATCDCWLAQHLAIFHPNIEPGAGHDIGWHVHLLFPPSSPDDDDSPDDGGRAPVDHWWTAGLQGGIDLAQNGESLVLWKPLTDGRCRNHAFADASASARGHFLQTYLSSANVRELICVARC